jgi:histidine ammonia-lyase
MPDASTFILQPGAMRLADLHAYWRDPRPVEIDPSAWPRVDAALAAVRRVIEENRTVYGVNTGFGSLARTHIHRDDLAELQHRLVRSHACGLGEPLRPRVVRLTLLLKIGSLARGHSGVRREVIETLTALLNNDALPVLPGQGSVGASGDLAPLAHLSAALIGEGEVDLKGERTSAKAALERLGLPPLTLEAKEGLALLNGTQVSTALALEGVFRAYDLCAAGLVAGAMSVDAALGSDVPFDPRIHEVRGQPGQIAAAGVLARLIAGSGIRASHLDCDRVQDPYSLRCQPQVMGAALDTLDAAAATLTREANAVSDNPLVFPEQDDILSGGNFHAEPVGFAADMTALAIAEVGAISERRIAMLTDARMSELPPFLVPEPGLNSGFMLAHVTAAALASETKQMSHPAVVDSLPTSANQEDHVSMATHGARRLGSMADNVGRILAIELLAAAQGIDLRRPLHSSEPLEKAHARIRDHAAFMAEDRSLAPAVTALAEAVASGWFLEEVVGAQSLPGLAAG